MDVLSVRGLNKSFRDNSVLTGLDLSVRKGEVYGFLGRNGSGKTTTIKIILGLSRPDAGTVSINAGSIGFLPDVPAYHPWMRADEFLRYCGKLSGLRGRALESRVDMLLSLSKLSGQTQKIMDFSRGMRQRLGMAQALINAPDLLILDEPTSALDPLGRRDVLDMIQELKGKATVMFSTHLLDDAERVCDRVGILQGGRLIVEAPIGELTTGDSSSIDLVVSPIGDSERPRLEHAIAEAGWKLERSTPHRRSLESAFVAYTETTEGTP